MDFPSIIGFNPVNDDEDSMMCPEAAKENCRRSSRGAGHADPVVDDGGSSSSSSSSATSACCGGGMANRGGGGAKRTDEWCYDLQDKTFRHDILAQTIECTAASTDFITVKELLSGRSLDRLRADRSDVNHTQHESDLDGVRPQPSPGKGELAIGSSDGEISGNRVEHENSDGMNSLGGIERMSPDAATDADTATLPEERPKTTTTTEDEEGEIHDDIVLYDDDEEIVDYGDDEFYGEDAQNQFYGEDTAMAVSLAICAEVAKHTQPDESEDIIDNTQTTNREDQLDGLEQLNFDLLLCRAAFLGRTDIVTACLERDVDLHYTEPTSGRSPLHFAVCGRALDATSAILDHVRNRVVIDAHEDTQRDIINKRDPKGWTALHLAVCRGCTQIAERLLDAGADPEMCLKHNCAPCRVDRVESKVIHFAALRGYSAVVDLLLDRGIDVNSVDEHNRTALHYAACRALPSLVEHLINKGAITSIADIHNRTPLHSAALGGQLKNCQLLAAAAADLSAIDFWDMTPSALALACGHQDVALYLEGKQGVTGGIGTNSFIGGGGGGAFISRLLSQPAGGDGRDGSDSDGGSTGKHTKRRRCAVEPLMDPLQRAVATAIVTGLKEPKEAQVFRAVKRLGPENCLKFYNKTLKVSMGNGMMTANGERRREPGGIFFTLLRGSLRDTETGKVDWKYIIQEDEERLKAATLKRRAKRRADMLADHEKQKHTSSASHGHHESSSSATHPQGARRRGRGRLAHERNNGGASGPVPSRPAGRPRGNLRCSRGVDTGSCQFVGPPPTFGRRPAFGAPPLEFGAPQGLGRPSRGRPAADDPFRRPPAFGGPPSYGPPFGRPPASAYSVPFGRPPTSGTPFW